MSKVIEFIKIFLSFPNISSLKRKRKNEKKTFVYSLTAVHKINKFSRANLLVYLFPGFNVWGKIDKCNDMYTNF